MLWLMLPLALLLALGGLYARQYPAFEIAKDIFYVGKTMVALGLGFVLASYLKDLRTLCRIVVAAAAISSAGHIVEAVIGLASGMSVFDLRAEEIRGNYINIIGLAVLLYFWRFKRHLAVSRAYFYIALSACTLSLIFSFSRTYILLFIGTMLVLKGWGRINLKNVFRIGIVLTLLFSFFIFTPSGESIGRDKSLLGKFSNVASELAFKNYTEMRDINQYWRGFESYRALVAFLGGGHLQKVFGQGLGATIDLGFYMNLGGSEMRYIPILHNGYMYVVVKFGLVGLLIVLYWFYRIIKLGSVEINTSMNAQEVFFRRLIAAIGWSFLFSTFVIAGIFNGNMYPTLILLGALFGWIGYRRSFQ